jgi:hypothetical protein
MKYTMKKIIAVALISSFLSSAANAADDKPFVALSADCDNNPIVPKCEVRNFYNKVLNCTIETTIGLTGKDGVVERLQVQTLTIQPNSKVIIVGHSYPMLTFKYILTSASCFQPY